MLPTWNYVSYVGKETCGRRGKAMVSSATTAVDFLNRPMDEEIRAHGSFEVRPYEIVILALE